MIFICGGISVLYIFLAIRPLARELHFKPEWTVNIVKTDVIPGGTELIPFKLGQSMGYFSEDGRFSSIVNFPVKATITDEYYSSFGFDNGTIEIRRKDGSLQASVDAAGFPFFEKDRFFVMLPGGSSVMEVDGDGNEKWRFEGYIPITAFSSSARGRIVGFADGTVYTFTEDGAADTSYSPGGSKYPVILGAAISPDGQYTATVSGQEKQRFVLNRKSGSSYKTVFHEYFDEDQTHQVLVRFSSDGKYVFYNYKGGLGVYSVSAGTAGHVAIPGYVVDIQESGIGGMLYVLSKQGRTFTVTMIEYPSNNAGSFSFEADSASISAHGDSLFVGRDSQISRIKITRS